MHADAVTQTGEEATVLPESSTPHCTQAAFMASPAYGMADTLVNEESVPKESPYSLSEKDLRDGYAIIDNKPAETPGATGQEDLAYIHNDELAPPTNGTHMSSDESVESSHYEEPVTYLEIQEGT